MSRFSFLVFLFIILGCASQDTPPTITEDIPMEIKSVMDDQVKSWNDGDIDAFMEGYWKSKELTFIGGRGVQKGWQNTLDGYKRAYDTPEKMGDLTFTQDVIQPLSDTSAYVLGGYALAYQDSLLSKGYFTLIWMKKDDKWVVVSDQTSEFK